MKLSDLTLIQWLGIVLVINGALSGAAGEMTDLFGPVWAKHVLSICVIGSGICGGMITMFGGIGTQARNVVSAGARIEVPAQTSPVLATLALNGEDTKIVPARGADAALSMIVKLLLIAFLPLALLAISQSAHAQGVRRQPQMIDPFKPIGDKIKSDLDQANSRVTATVTGQPATDPKAALPCMDITVLFKLTPANLVPTMKACVQDANNQLVTDTQRALDSAKNYTKTGENTPVGDSDGINCLTPALALFQAASIVPATPDVLNPDGSVKTKGAPELDPGLILLFQKYREFTISGGLTSCQAWVNGPVNATAAAGIAGVGAAAGAALLLPK